MAVNSIIAVGAVVAPVTTLAVPAPVKGVTFAVVAGMM